MTASRCCCRRRSRTPRRFAEALRAGAEKLSPLQGEARTPVSISVGVAPLDAKAGSSPTSLAAAETACKAAKDRGRNRVEIYQQATTSASCAASPTSPSPTKLRDAIDEDRLHLDAQLILPFAAAESARPHYELLLRMIGRGRQALGPDSFLSAAVRYQMMPVIDRWVVKHAIDALKPRAGVLEGEALGFTINFSGQSLERRRLRDFLIEASARAASTRTCSASSSPRTPPSRNLSRAEALMRRLRQLGCGVALDDFGTGLSSLSCLRQLPVTMLKIDGSFVRDVLKDPRAESMVRAIAQLARTMSITTVAEYIETEAISQRIAQLGVDYGQGFAIGRPIPLADLLRSCRCRTIRPEAAEPAADTTSMWYAQAGGTKT